MEILFENTKRVMRLCTWSFGTDVKVPCRQKSSYANMRSRKGSIILCWLTGWMTSRKSSKAYSIEVGLRSRFISRWSKYVIRSVELRRIRPMIWQKNLRLQSPTSKYAVDVPSKYLMRHYSFLEKLKTYRWWRYIATNHAGMGEAKTLELCASCKAFQESAVVFWVRRALAWASFFGKALRDF